MFYRSLLLMLALVAGIYLWPEDKTVESGVAHSAPLTVSGQSRSQTEIDDAPAMEQYVIDGRQATPHSLAESSGNELLGELESFWKECQQHHNCEQALAQLTAELSDARYRLVARYPELKAQWQRVLGDLTLKQYTALADRVAEIKQQAFLTWGELADVIFAEEYALYDFSLASQKLASDDPEAYVESYETLLEQWQENRESLSLDSGSARYEKGVSLIPSNFTPAQSRQVKAQLAQTYLDAEQSVSIVQRELQVASQQVQVESYQSQLYALRNKLEEQRLATGAALSEPEWQQYLDQQLSEFRINFFNHD